MKLIQKFAVVYIRIRFRILSVFSRQKAAQTAFDLFCTPQVRSGKKLPARFAEAEQLQFNFGEDSITGYRWNKGGKRRLLILHGFESSAARFDHFIIPLVEKGYEVLAFDAPAHGKSGGRQINALVYRDFTKYIHDQYGPFQSSLAHSFGGLALCLALPDISHDNDYRAVLIAPATDSTTTIGQFFQYLRINDPAVKRGFEELVIAKSGHPISWFSVGRTVEQIQAKILWVHDEEDNVTPFADAEIIKNKNYPGIQFVITKGLGHSRIYRDATVSKTILDFL